MSKRAFNKYERRPRDFYQTPLPAVKPLVRFLPDDGFTFIEPCCGDGRLVEHIETLTLGMCNGMWDINPDAGFGRVEDALELDDTNYQDTDFIITNPPWDRNLLHPMIEKFASNKPTWLLFDADWFHTKQADDYKPYLHKFVSIGRVSWMENGTSGFDNCSWYNFDLTRRVRFAEAY